MKRKTLDINAPALKAFKQHGFAPKGTSGNNQVFGSCPFCGKADKFYVNVNTKQWDCKVCSKKGGFQIFLREIVEYCKSHFKLKPAINLAKERSLKLSMLRKFNVGYNPNTGCYILPIYNMTGEELQDVRIYKNKKFMSTSGCQVGLLGWEKVDKVKDVHSIWLCEGEWDGIAMNELLKGNDVTDELVLAVPGANTFKAEWNVLFKDMRVNVLYDNDEPGRDGAIKVYNNIQYVVKDFRFIHWSEKHEDGFDIRDLYKRNDLKPKKTLRGIRSLLRDLPQGIDLSITESEGKTSHVKYTGDGLPAETVYKNYRDWLYLPDSTPLDVIYGTIIANRFEGDPLWLFLVAPPGGSKTELLMTFSDCKNIVTTTSITPHSLISGANFGGSDPSLIPLLNNNVLIVKDFTTILNMPAMSRDEIFGIFRDAYDGKTEKRFGNGVFRSYRSKFGFIAGVTPAIEIYADEHAALGERFIRYKLPQSRGMKEDRELLRRAMRNVANEEKMRKALNDTAKEALNYDFKKLPSIPASITDKVIYLAQWTSLMRGTVNRDKYTKEVTHNPFSEKGTRLTKQFSKLMMGIGMFKRKLKVDETEYKVVRDIGVGTVPTRLESCARNIYRYGMDKAYSVHEISEMVRLPSMTVGRLTENLNMLGILQRDRLNRMKTEFRLTEDILEIIDGAGIYSK